MVIGQDAKLMTLTCKEEPEAMRKQMLKKWKIGVHIA